MAGRASTRQRDAKFGLIRILGVALQTLPSGGSCCLYHTDLFLEISYGNFFKVEILSN